MTCLPAGDQSVLDSNIFASTNELEPSATHLCQLLKERVCFSSFRGKDKRPVSLYTPAIEQSTQRFTASILQQKFLRSQEVVPNVKVGVGWDIDSMCIHTHTYPQSKHLFFFSKDDVLIILDAPFLERSHVNIKIPDLGLRMLVDFSVLKVKAAP